MQAYGLCHDPKIAGSILVKKIRQSCHNFISRIIILVIRQDQIAGTRFFDQNIKDMQKAKFSSLLNATLSKSQMNKVRGGDGEESSQTAQLVMTIQAQMQAD